MELIVYFFEDSEEGGFTAHVPCLCGAISEGDTLEDAVSNITEAIELYLDVQFEEMEQDDKVVFPELPADFSFGTTKQDMEYAEAVLHNFAQLSKRTIEVVPRRSQSGHEDDLSALRAAGRFQKTELLVKA